jgi:hypothetical protein
VNTQHSEVRFARPAHWTWTNLSLDGLVRLMIRLAGRWICRTGMVRPLSKPLAGNDPIAD